MGYQSCRETRRRPTRPYDTAVDRLQSTALDRPRKNAAHAHCLLSLAAVTLLVSLSSCTTKIPEPFATGEPCLPWLEQQLREAGYAVAIRHGPTSDEPSVVDATNRYREENDLDVVILSDGQRMHIVAPFITYAEARRMVRPRDQGSLPMANACIVAERVYRALVKRKRTRNVLLGTLAAALLALLALLAASPRYGASER